VARTGADTFNREGVSSTTHSDVLTVLKTEPATSHPNKSSRAMGRTLRSKDTTLVCGSTRTSGAFRIS
jgi:hypothetical protein